MNSRFEKKGGMMEFNENSSSSDFTSEDHIEPHDQVKIDEPDAKHAPSIIGDHRLFHEPSINERLDVIENLLKSRFESEPEYSEEILFYRWLKSEYKNRSIRTEFFRSDYTNGEPSWNILLDLCVADIEGKRISVTSSCIASGAPMATALRWISLMENDGLVVKSPDQHDKRRTFISITRKAHNLLKSYYSRIAVE